MGQWGHGLRRSWLCVRWPPSSAGMHATDSSFTKSLGMCYLPLHSQAFLIKVILDQSLNK